MNSLFSTYDGFSLLENQKKKMLGHIENLDKAKVLNTKLEEWADYFVQEYSIQSLELDESAITQEIVDTHADPKTLVDGGNYFSFRDSFEKQMSVPATEVQFYVPFIGDKQLFEVRPSTFNHSPPRVQITDTELICVYRFGTVDAIQAKNLLEKTLKEIKQFIGWQKNDFEVYNATLKGIALKRLEERFEKFKKDSDAASSLGFPMRKRGNVQQTYVVPSIKKKVVPTSQVAQPTPKKIEPELSLADYDYILGVMRNMVTVMEQSPHAFKGMDEETLRSHFLVQLNGQYEGQATGETFNFEGKTDILIKDNGKNIFIAECKFWKGAEGFQKTIDQLLGYLSWRDTKCAILVFNRNKNLSAVLAQIPDLVKNHSGFVREWRRSSNETEFKFILHHRDDVSRELFLTVQVYEIPV